MEANGFLAPHGIAQDYSGGRIERIDIDTGAVEILYKSGDFGCSLRGPNDIVFDAHGGFWFTDHGKIDYAKRSHDVVGIFYAKVPSADGKNHLPMPKCHRLMAKIIDHCQGAIG
jgi:gluconolactonase